MMHYTNDNLTKLQLLSKAGRRSCNLFLAVAALYLLGAVPGLRSIDAVADAEPAGTATIALDTTTISPKKGATSHQQKLLIVYHDTAYKPDKASEEAQKQHAAIALNKPTVEFFGTSHNFESLAFNNCTPLGSVGGKHYWSVDMDIQGLVIGKEMEIPLWLSLAKSSVCQTDSADPEASGGPVTADATPQDSADASAADSNTAEAPQVDDTEGQQVDAEQKPTATEHEQVAVRSTSLKVLAVEKKGALTWEVSAPPEDVLYSKEPQTNFMLSTGDEPALGIEVKMSSLQDDATKRIISTDKLQLCKDVEAAECVPINIDSRSDQGVVLKVNDLVYPGTYKGEVTIGPSNEKSPKPLKLNVYVTTTQAKLMGWGLILLGLLITFFIKVFARHWTAKKQAQLAVALAQKNLHKMQDQLDAITDERNIELKHIPAELDEYLVDLQELSDSVRLNSLLFLTSNDYWKNGFKTAIDSVNAKAVIMDILIQDGIQTLHRQLPDDPQGEFPKAVHQIDEIVMFPAKIKDSATVQNELNGILDRYITRGLFADPSEVARSTVSADTIAFQIGLVNSSVWLIWLLVSAVAGAYTLIYSNPGFGIAEDLFTCLFWGLGFGIAGNQLEQITTASTAQTMEINFPKAAS